MCNNPKPEATRSPLTQSGWVRDGVFIHRTLPTVSMNPYKHTQQHIRIIHLTCILTACYSIASDRQDRGYIGEERAAMGRGVCD